MVSTLIIEDNTVKGVNTSMGFVFTSTSVVLTSGTFMNGLIHIGRNQFGGGRMAEKASTGITEQLVSLGFQAGRMKTGTPPRIDGRTLDYSKMEEQKGDEKPSSFSYLTEKPLTKQRSCYITYTNPAVHQALQKGFDDSPMFNGTIKSLGPRYCPSIEDKINRFAERDRHQIFVEPEGWNTVEIYVNGFSTSLPADIQIEALQLIPGFENAKIFRPGYAIEYDFFPPTQLAVNLETKIISNLFFAGQINGTTGYEEAACQGLMAGINAHQKINSLEAFILSRSEAYIGVLIDDLINKGTEEPYRMFTSRAEYRILLRQDNADGRLTEKGYQLGLVSDIRHETYLKKQKNLEELKHYIETTGIPPEEINPVLIEKETAVVDQKYKFKKLLSRPQLHTGDFSELPTCKDFLSRFGDDVKEQVEILIKYQGYIEKEREMALKIDKFESLFIKPDFDFDQLPSLSSEAKEKLGKIRPHTIGQASRISGVSPSDISVLLVYFGR